MAITELDLGFTAPRARRPITAAALNLADTVSNKQLVRQLRRHQAWQRDAIGYGSELGEVHYVVNRAASALSEAVLYCATKSENGPLVPVDAPESMVTSAVAQIAMAELEKLRSPVGGQKQLIHQAYVNSEIPGEFFLIQTDDGEQDEGWWIRSILETKIGEPGEPVQIQGVGEVPYDSVSRVWRPHPFRFEAADSGMRAVLGACELVILIDRTFRAAMRSRLFAGLLLMPNGLRQGQPDKSQKGDPKADPFVDDFVDALNAGIGEEGSASAVTPNFLWGNPDDLKEVRRVEFAQQVNPEVLALRDSSIQRIVQGLEYPPEIVTGTGDASHWGAWFIGDSFIDHIRPKGNFLADAFTTVFLWPGLEAQGVPREIAREIVLDFDYSPLQRRPNIVETATEAHDRLVISDATLRKDLGYDDADAPDDAEVMAREARKQTAKTDIGVSTGPPAQGPEAIAAAFTNDLGGQLARVDWELIERLFGATVTAMRRASERAGNRARSRVASAHREAVRGVPSVDVCAQLGPTLLAAAGLTEDELLADGFAALERDYRRWTRETANNALSLVDDEHVLTPEERASWERQRDDNIDTSWSWLAGALGASLSRRIAEGGDPIDAEIRTLIRQAVASAGGVAEFAAAEAIETGAAMLRVPVSAVTGIGTGPITLDMLGSLGKEVAGWRWVHDSPEHPFPPHVALDGAEASTVDEFATGFDDWPGSHSGCRCLLEVLIRRTA